jgi:hypothetical protein
MNADMPNHEKVKKPTHPEPVQILFGTFEAGEAIAEELVSFHHSHLASAKFLFCCRNKAQKQGGKVVPGTVKRASPLEKHLSHKWMKNEEDSADFIMIIALDAWNDLNPKQRIALIDHLLTRCVAEEIEATGEMKFSIRPPEVQEFPEVIIRNGKWNDSIISFSDSLDESNTHLSSEE